MNNCYNYFIDDWFYIPHPIYIPTRSMYIKIKLNVKGIKDDDR